MCNNNKKKNKENEKDEAGQAPTPTDLIIGGRVASSASYISDRINEADTVNGS